VDDYLPDIRRVSAADVQAAARALLGRENRTSAVLVPTRQAAEPLPPMMPPGGKVIR
jgi:predicted Zn-dependent peptidase